MCGLTACCASVCCCPCIAQGALQREAKTWESGLKRQGRTSSQAQAIIQEIRGRVASIADRLQTACTEYVENHDELSAKKIEKIELRVDTVIRALAAYERSFACSIEPISLGIAESKKKGGMQTLKMSYPVGALMEIVKAVPELSVEVQQHGKHLTAHVLVGWDRLRELQEAAQLAHH